MIKNNSLSSISFHLNLICDLRSRFRRHGADIESISADIMKDVTSLIKTMKHLGGVCGRHELTDSADRIVNAAKEIDHYVNM